MGIILLLVGLSGIMLLFMIQNFRSTKTSLSRIKAFSDNLVENMPIGLIALDNQSRIAAFNHTAEAVLQQTFQEVVGKNAGLNLPSELYAELKYLEIENQLVEKEINCTVGDGKIVPLEIGASVLEDENKTFLGYIILFKDLTEVRALRREIERKGQGNRRHYDPGGRSPESGRQSAARICETGQSVAAAHLSSATH
jgi:two-component system sensor histidine kinase HydH